MEMFLSGYFHRKENQPQIIIRKRQIIRETKAAEIYERDSIKSNIHRQPLGLLPAGIKYRNNQPSDPEGSAKSPLAGPFCIQGLPHGKQRHALQPVYCK